MRCMAMSKLLLRLVRVQEGVIDMWNRTRRGRISATQCIRLGSSLVYESPALRGNRYRYYMLMISPSGESLWCYFQSIMCQWIIYHSNFVDPLLLVIHSVSAPYCSGFYASVTYTYLSTQALDYTDRSSGYELSYYMHWLLWGWEK